MVNVLAIVPEWVRQRRSVRAMRRAKDICDSLGLTWVTQHEWECLQAERDYWRAQARNLADAGDLTIDHVRSGGHI